MSEIRKAASLGREAQRLLDDPTLKQAFEAVEKSIINAMKRADVSNYQEVSQHRDALILSLKLLGRVEGWLNSAISTGKVAQEELDRLE